MATRETEITPEPPEAPLTPEPPEIKHPAELLLSERLRLRFWRRSEAEETFKVVWRHRERLGRFLPWVAATKGPEASLEFIERIERTSAEGTEYAWSIRARTETGERGRLLGSIGIHSIKREAGRCEIGYWIAEEGQGFVTEAVRRLEAELARIGFTEARIHCSAENHRSAAVPRRLGYELIKREMVLPPGATEKIEALVFAKPID